jgi:hypothetical protein
MSGLTTEGVKGECVKGEGWIACALLVSAFSLHALPFASQLGFASALS